MRFLRPDAILPTISVEAREEDLRPNLVLS
jgi:hypothetical protein